MKLYRCINQEQYNIYKQGEILFKLSSGDCGCNTFDYKSTDEPTAHFFLLPECANYYADLSSEIQYIITVEIENLDDYEFGFGQYKIGMVRPNIYHGEELTDEFLIGMIIPFPEVRIHTADISFDSIKKVDTYVETEGIGDNYFKLVKKIIKNKRLNGSLNDYDSLLDEIEYLLEDDIEKVF